LQMRDGLQFLHDTNYMWKWGLNKHPGREFSELPSILGLPSWLPPEHWM